MSSARSLPIAVLISGGGSTLRNLIECVAREDLLVEIRVVISSNPTARGNQFAEAAGIPLYVVQRNECKSAEAFRDAIFQICRDAGVQLVVMAGFLKHVLIPTDFTHRVMNIHPSLIPHFCGRGFYGLRVHRAVLDADADTTGCTVHFVDNEYDHGPIILQREVTVEQGDTPETLASRVFATECEALPTAISLFVAGRLRVLEGQVVVGGE